MSEDQPIFYFWQHLSLPWDTGNVSVACQEEIVMNVRRGKSEPQKKLGERTFDVIAQLILN